MLNPSKHKATGGHSLARNTLLNLVGQAVPIVIGLVSIPLLIKHLGMDRFGLLSLIWVVIGYFAYFDLGLGRAIVKIVAEKIGGARESEIPAVVWTALAIMGGMSLLGSVIFSLLSPVLVLSIFKIPEVLRAEAIEALVILSGALVLVTLTAGLRGVFEARQRFDYANILQMLVGASAFVGPLLTSFFSQSLVTIVVVFVLSRLVIFIGHCVLIVRLYPELARPRWVEKDGFRELSHFATWMTVSNVISPIMVYFDRFLLGAVVPVAALAFYTTPHEVVSRLLVVPGALVRTLLPTFASLGSEGGARVNSIFELGLKVLWLILFPIVLVIVYFGKEGLSLWLGPEFAQYSTVVLQLLSIGILFNALAFVPLTLIQSVGRPDLTGKVHLCELPIFLPLVWMAASRFGVVGAACAWSFRVILDMGLMFVGARIVLPSLRGRLWRILLPISAMALGFVPAFFDLDFGTRLLLVSVGLPVFLLVFWRFLLNYQDRVGILKLLRIHPARDSWLLRFGHRVGFDDEWEPNRVNNCSMGKDSLVNDRSVSGPQPKVAIVLATYNPPERFFRRQLESIRAQTHGNWVCILTDDSPAGAVRERVSALAREILGVERTIVLEPGSQPGVVVNFVRGLGAVPADCPFIAFCDQDDIWHPEKLRKLIGLFTGPDVMAVHSDLALIDAEERVIAHSCWKNEGRDLTALEAKRLILRNSVSGCALLFRREVLEFCLPLPGWTSSGPLFYHDVWVALGALAKGKIVSCPDALVFYRQHGGNVVGAEMSRRKHRLSRSFLFLQEAARKCWVAWRRRSELERAYLERARVLGVAPGMQPIFNRWKDFGAVIALAAIGAAFGHARGYLRIGLQIAIGKFMHDIGVPFEPGQRKINS